MELRRYYYVTPKNYLDYISNYQKQMSQNKTKIKNADKRLEGGLTKLLQAAKDVARMQKELEKAKVIVDAKAADCEVMIGGLRVMNAAVISRR